MLSLTLTCGFLLAIASHASALDETQKHTPFMIVLLRAWNQWDTNKDGELTSPEIERAVMDPTVKEDDAAVAGTLKLITRNTKLTVPRLTLAYFADYEKRALMHPNKPIGAVPTTAPADPSTAAAANKPINWDLSFNAARRRIAKGVDTVWPTKFNLDHVQQGPLGDCYLLATVGSMIVHNPGELEQLVKPIDNGYRVTIPGKQPFTVPPLTQSQLVLSSTTSGEGDWVAVIEQALGRYNEITKGSSDDEGTDSIAGGGQITTTMALLTGHKFKRIHMRTTLAERAIDETKTLIALRDELTSAVHDGRLITASVHPPTLTPTTLPTANVAPPRVTLTADMLPKIPPNITTKHAYAIVSFDADKDMLEVWNPHGQTFKPKGPDGPQHGYATTHGIFHVPLKEAYGFFTSFVFEVNTPAGQRPGDLK